MNLATETVELGFNCKFIDHSFYHCFGIRQTLGKGWTYWFIHHKLNVLDCFQPFRPESFGDKAKIASFVVSFLQNLPQRFIANFGKGKCVENRWIPNSKPRFPQRYPDNMLS